MTRSFSVRLALLILVLSTLPSAIATVDLLSPANAAATNTSTITFEYYASLAGLTGCAIVADAQSFPDPDVVNDAMNSVQVQNIATGFHSWSVTCTGDTTETSPTRTFRIDTQAPTVTLVTPADGSTQPQLAVDFIPNDDQDAQLACTVSWNDQQLAATLVTANTHYAATFTVPASTGTLTLRCEDDAGNAAIATRTVTIDPPLFLTLTTDKQEYGITEPVRLTVQSVAGANVTVDICPNQQGFVQCTTALLTTSFPQTITLPFMNKTGSYLVDGFVQSGTRTAANSTTYAIVNSLTVSVPNEHAQPNEEVSLAATIGGGVPPYAISWKIPNGTIFTQPSITLSYPSPGAYNFTVTVNDSAGNARQENVTLTVDRIYPVIVRVIDNATGELLSGASVDVDGTTATTSTDGTAYFNVAEGAQTVFVSAAGYGFVALLRTITVATTIDVLLDRSASAPIVTIAEATPTRISYTATHVRSLACTLELAPEGGPYAAHATQQVSSGTHEFAVSIDTASNARVTCNDAGGLIGVSPPATIQIASVTPVAPTSDDLFLQTAQDDLSARLAAIEAASPKEREAIALAELDARVRNAKRAVQQAIRDLDSLQFRSDLDDAARAAERTRIIEQARATFEGVPRSISVLDTNTVVRYPAARELAAIATQLAGVDGMIEDPERIANILEQDQQRFTISATFWHLALEYERREETITLVSKTFTYADDLPAGMWLAEVIPKEILEDARDIAFITKGEILVRDPVLRFPAAERVTYLIPKRVDFDRAATIHTVLARTISSSETDALTGFAIFGAQHELFGVPIIWLIVLVGIISVASAFGFWSQIKYFVYRLGSNERVHYVRVLVHDAQDQLQASNYEKAELLYKEIRLTYDTLSQLARNDLYEEVVELVHAMDAYYFNLMMIEMDRCLKEHDEEGAIAAYERLTGTFARLDDGRKQQLVDAVTGMARRLGVAA